MLDGCVFVCIFAKNLKQNTMSRHTITLAVVLTAGILSAGCSMDKTETTGSKQENYRDKLFVAMQNDTLLVHQEQLIQNADSIAFYAHFELPMLWDEGGDTTLRKMADFYNYCYNVNAITTDVDTWYRYDADEAMKKELLDSWRQIAFKGISDSWAVRRMREARDVDTEEKGDPEMKDLTDVYQKLSSWAPEIDSIFYTDTLVPRISPQNFLPDSLRLHYEEYIGQEAEPSGTMKADLFDQYQKEENFDTRMAMLFTLIGTYYYSIDTSAILLKDAESAFTSGNYSPLMPLVWRAYRASYCNTYSCPSTYCERPNVRFNYYRRLIAYTYLRHIERHPDDKVAIIQYCCLAEQDNINRFGEYMFGHEGGTEYILLFWSGAVL